MYANNSKKCRQNLNLDIKIWYSEIDCLFHWTLITHEQHFYVGKCSTVAQCLYDIELKTDIIMHEETVRVSNK
jgi:hypothetical protein